MKLVDTMSVVENCFHGEPASCSHSCPLGLDVRAFIEKVARGKWVSAYKALRNCVVFPVVVSRLCSAPCKSDCQRVDLGDEPIELPLIERAVIEYSKKKSAEKYVIPPKDQSVAIIGAGVSGLACALDLAQKKYLVTVFDKNEGWGGSLREHEDFSLFEEDFNLQFEAVDIIWKFNHEIKSNDELTEFNMIHHAIGNHDGDVIDAIAMGTSAARRIEVFLKTGREDTETDEKKDCSRHVIHHNVDKAPRVVAKSGDGYTEDEVLCEAGRCMQCDCSACMNSCEMLSEFRKKPKKIATEVYTDTQISSTFSAHTLTRQTYSCNMCHHCESVCPEGINMGQLFTMSRRNRFETETVPYALHDYWLSEMDFNTESAEFCFMPDKNSEKSSNYDNDGVRYVFYPGCQLGAHNPEHVLMTYKYLAENFDCGVYLGCCGAPAYWAGDDKRLCENVDAIRKTSKALGEPVFIFACATCETLFDEYLPEIKRIPLYKLLVSGEGIKAEKVFSDASIFDPCSARGDEDMMDAVRLLAEYSGINLSELPKRNRCCGYGGLVRGGNPKMYERVAQARSLMHENPYIVYCANCREVLLSQGKECAHILDIAFNLPVRAEVPKISERRRNSLHVKSKLMRELKNEMYEPVRQPWDDIELVIDKVLAEEIDKKLISEDDMKEAIWLAETSGDKFTYEDDGSFTACFVRRVLTYWVRYKVLQQGETYEILNAYYHRMSFEKAEN